MAIEQVSDAMALFDRCAAEEVPVVRVPHDVDSVAAAVARLGPCGRVIVAQGKYQENIVVKSGTQVIIEAEGPERPEFFAAERDRPVVYVEPNADLCLVSTCLHGARSGLVAGSKRSGVGARTVLLRNCLVADAECGIYGRAKCLHVEGSVLRHNGYGMAVAGSTWITCTLIESNGFNALLMSDWQVLSCSEAAYRASGTQVVIEHVTVMYGKQGGMAICGVGSATLKNVYVLKNEVTGLWIHNTAKFALSDSHVRETQQVGDGCWGDGLRVENSNGTVRKCWFSANQRVNVLFDASGGAIEQNMILYGMFAIYLDSGADPTVDGNYMFGNTENGVSWGSYLAPSTPPKVPEL